MISQAAAAFLPMDDQLQQHKANAVCPFPYFMSVWRCQKWSVQISTFMLSVCLRQHQPVSTRAVRLHELAVCGQAGRVIVSFKAFGKSHGRLIQMAPGSGKPPTGPGMTPTDDDEAEKLFYRRSFFILNHVLNYSCNLCRLICRLSGYGSLALLCWYRGGSVFLPLYVLEKDSDWRYFVFVASKRIVHIFTWIVVCNGGRGEGT